MENGELHRILGSLEAQVRESRRQNDKMFAKIEEVDVKVTTLSTEFQTRFVEDDARHKRNEDALDQIRPIVENYNLNKNKVVGILIGVAGLGAAAWEGVSKTASTILKNMGGG